MHTQSDTDAFACMQVVPEKKKKHSNRPPKVAAAQAVEPSEEDEFEQLGRGITYTDVWRLSTRDYSWTRVPTTGEVLLPNLPSQSYRVVSDSLCDEDQSKGRRKVRSLGAARGCVSHSSAPTADDVLDS